MKRRVQTIVAALLIVAFAFSATACAGEEKKPYFESEQTFHLDRSMSTPIGTLDKLCHPGTLTFKTDGTVKMDVQFTDYAKGLMQGMLNRVIDDFVHNDTYKLNEDKTQITYHPTREAFNGKDVIMEIERLSDNSMRVNFDIGAVITDTVLTFYSNPDMMPSLEPEPEPEKYSVSYIVEGEDLKGNTEESVKPEGASYDEPTEIELPELDFTNGKTIFRGWAPNGAVFEQGGKYLYQPGETYLVESSVEFVAVWGDTVTVTLSAGEGEGFDYTAEVGYGQTLVLPESTFKTPDSSMGFAYWEVDGKAKYPGEGIYSIKADKEITAVFTQLTDVAFAPGANGIGEAFTVRAPEESKLAMPENCYLYAENGAASENKGFRAWRQQGKTTNLNPGAKFAVPKGGAEVQPYWDTFVTATFEADGGTGTVEPIKVVKGVYFNLPMGEGLSKDGFTLAGWLKSGSTSKYALGYSTYISADTTYTANWQTSRTLTFAGGESATGSMAPIVSGETMKVTLPQNEFIMENMAFAGWSDGEKVYQAGAQYTVPDHNVTFTAQWESGQFMPYTVTFRAKQAGVIVGKNAKGEDFDISALMAMTELVVRPDLTADYVIKFKQDADIKENARALGVSISSLRKMEKDYHNVPYKYNAEKSELTLTVSETETIVLKVTKTAKNTAAETPIFYDRFEFTVPFKVGAATELQFTALDGKPAYLTAQKVLEAKDVQVPIVGKVTITLTVNPDGTGTLKAGFLISLTFFHMFNEDYSAVIWLGDTGDHVDGLVTTEANLMSIQVTMLGQTLTLKEKAA